MNRKQKVYGILTAICLALTLVACGKKQEPVATEMPVVEESTESEKAVQENQTPEVTEPEEEVPEEPEETGTPYDVIPEEFAYSLTVSINPLMELYFDADDKVVGMAFLNDDAVEAYKDLELVGKTVDESVDLLITAAVDKGYLKEDGGVEIELAKVGDAQQDGMTAVLVEAGREVKRVLSEKGEEAPAGTTVEVAVAKDVEETTGIKTPVICTACNGTGNDCKECNGTADVRCKRCNNGIESCGTCGGSAVINCHGCHGSGAGGPNGETCTRCGGSGRQSCDACGGVGKFSCSWCHGALHHICPECWGERVCAACNGTGMI